MEQLLPFVSNALYKLHCTQINEFENSTRTVLVNVLICWEWPLGIIFCFRDDRARST